MRKVLIALLSLTLIGGLSAPAQAANPKGTKWVDKSRSREIPGAVCGATWGKNGHMVLTAGKWVNKKKGTFVSYSQLAANDTKAAKKTKNKKKKKKLTKSAATNRSKANTFQSQCNTVNALKVNLAGKAGVAQGDTSASAIRSIKKTGPTDIRQVVGAGMNVFAVDAQGRFASMFPNLADLIAASKAICSGWCYSLPTVEGMISGPNDKIYLMFNQKFNFNDVVGNMNMGDANTCMLAVVTPSSTTLQCVDNELVSSMNWRGANQGNPSVQFDAAGNSYYKGQFVRGGGMQMGDNYYTALRRNANGVITEIVYDRQIQIDDFVVLPNGDVIVSGYTQKSQTTEGWVRLYPGDGVSDIVDLSGGGWGGFMRLFPDENVYFGGSNGSGLGRFLTQTNEVDGIYNFAQVNGGWCCGSLYMGDLDFGTSDRTDDYTFTLNGPNATQLWPQNDPTNPTAIVRSLGMSNPSMIEGAGSFLVVGGSEREISPDNGQLLKTTYKTNILNPLDGVITEVPGATGIEVYTLAYAGSGNLILNGKNRRGATVNGIVSVKPESFGTFTITQTDSGRVDDVQLFGQTN
jgi:hypothetical protein